MTSPLWQQTGGVWPLGVSSSVTWLDLGAIAHILQTAGIKTVLEIGVEHGGLSAWLMAYGRYNAIAYRGIDITLNALQTQVGWWIGRRLSSAMPGQPRRWRMRGSG